MAVGLAPAPTTRSASSRSRCAKLPALKGTMEPRNCTVRRRSKSSPGAPSFASPGGFAIIGASITNNLSKQAMTLRVQLPEISVIPRIRKKQPDRETRLFDEEWKWDAGRKPPAMCRALGRRPPRDAHGGRCTRVAAAAAAAAGGRGVGRSPCARGSRGGDAAGDGAADRARRRRAAAAAAAAAALLMPTPACDLVVATPPPTVRAPAPPAVVLPAAGRTSRRRRVPPLPPRACE